MKRIAIFASGTGSNALKIIQHFSAIETPIEVALIVCNNAQAGVLQIAATHQIPTLLINKDIFFKGHHYLPQLQQMQIDLIVLAGFLWKIPPKIIEAYPNKMINIHPALLPKYGGKGMYGNNVHEAVIANKETESGITIHYVNEHYDEGKIIFQAKCAITADDTPSTLANKIHVLEHLHFATIIEKQLTA